MALSNDLNNEVHVVNLAILGFSSLSTITITYHQLVWRRDLKLEGLLGCW